MTLGSLSGGSNPLLVDYRSLSDYYSYTTPRENEHEDGKKNDLKMHHLLKDGDFSVVMLVFRQWYCVVWRCGGVEV